MAVKHAGKPDVTGHIVKVSAQSDPAAGANKVITLPTGKIWRVLAGAIRLDADSNAANREILVSFQSGGEPYWATSSDYTQVADETVRYMLIGGVNVGDLTSLSIHRWLPLPSEGLWMPVGASMTVLVTGIQAGDQLDQINLLVEEYDA